MKVLNHMQNEVELYILEHLLQDFSWNRNIIDGIVEVVEVSQRQYVRKRCQLIPGDPYGDCKVKLACGKEYSPPRRKAPSPWWTDPVSVKAARGTPRNGELGMKSEKVALQQFAHGRAKMKEEVQLEIWKHEEQESCDSVECVKIDKSNLRTCLSRGRVRQHISTSAHLSLPLFQRSCIFCQSFVPACCAHARLTVIVTLSPFGSRNNSLEKHHATRKMTEQKSQKETLLQQVGDHCVFDGRVFFFYEAVALRHHQRCLDGCNISQTFRQRAAKGNTVENCFNLRFQGG